jgi:DNA-binding NarL/FixJ family response regulator
VAQQATSAESGHVEAEGHERVSVVRSGGVSRPEQSARNFSGRGLTVLVGILEPHARAVVFGALQSDCCVRVIGSDLDDDALDGAVGVERPGVVIVGEASDYQLLTGLMARRPAPGVLAVVHDPSRLYRSTLVAGGVWCISQASSSTEILTAVRRAADRRGTTFQREPSSVVGADPGESQSSRDILPAVSTLTPREREVLERLAAGWLNKQIAGDLRISVRTVETYAAQVQRKLGLQRREIVGLVPPGERRHPG